MDEKKSDSYWAIPKNEPSLNLLEREKLASKNETIRKRQTSSSQKEGKSSDWEKLIAALKAPWVVVGKEIWWGEEAPQKRSNIQEGEWS